MTKIASMTGIARGTVIGKRDGVQPTDEAEHFFDAKPNLTRETRRPNRTFRRFYYRTAFIIGAIFTGSVRIFFAWSTL
jgi:hypothetical protein